VTFEGMSHYTLDFEENAEGWWKPRCVCGYVPGAFPTGEDAADALMQHAYEQGILDATRASRPPKVTG
jgi:hypothetical protein